MSAGGGSSQVYLNVSDPAADDAGLTLPLSDTQFSSINQNQPDVAVGPTHTVVAWEQSSGGWEIQLSVAPTTPCPAAWSTWPCPSASPFLVPTATRTWRSTGARCT